MAKRPVYVAKGKNGFEEYWIEFKWNAGLSKSQKQKNIRAIHEAFTEQTDKPVLEISSKSMQEAGTRLSAFALPLYMASLGRSVTLEQAYQAAKVYEQAGPFTDLLGDDVTPGEAKRDPRHKDSGALIHYFFEGKAYPAEPINAFYNWLWTIAVLQQPDLAKEVLQYDAFTDIEAAPNKAINCQARAAAVFKSIYGDGLPARAPSFEEYLAMVSD